MIDPQHALRRSQEGGEMTDHSALYAEAVAYAQKRSTKISPEAVEAVLTVLRACRASHAELQQAFIDVAQERHLPGLAASVRRWPQRVQ
jgi:hypothetical protein